MKKLIKTDVFHLIGKGFLLCLPFIVWQMIEVFFLPKDCFTFRIWEAATLHYPSTPGLFVPNLHLVKKQEYGDRYRFGFRENKPVEWYTDAYGFRNRPELEAGAAYDVVILGDSNIVGSFLDQKDTLAENLGRHLNMVVYSYGGGTPSLLFSDPRLIKHPPKLLVMESKAGNWFQIGTDHSDFLSSFQEMPDGTLEVRDTSQPFSFPTSLSQTYWTQIKNTFYKQAFLRMLKASLKLDFSPPIPKLVKNNTNNRLSSNKTSTSPKEEFTFLKHPPQAPLLTNTQRPLTKNESQYYFYHAIKAMHRKATERQMEFICFLMPDQAATPLIPVVKQLRLEGIKVIAYHPSKKYPSGVNEAWYWNIADSHWREAAVQLTADEIIRMWKNTGIVENRSFSEKIAHDTVKS